MERYDDIKVLTEEKTDLLKVDFRSTFGVSSIFSEQFLIFDNRI